MTEKEKQNPIPDADAACGIGHSYSPAHGYADALPTAGSEKRTLSASVIVAICLICVVLAAALGSVVTLLLTERRAAAEPDVVYTDAELVGEAELRSVSGIAPVTVSAAAAQYYNMVVGAYVYSVDEGSTAEAAGLHIGDIITAVGGTEIVDADSFLTAMEQYAAGDSVELTVFRDLESVTLTFIAE